MKAGTQAEGTNKGHATKGKLQVYMLDKFEIRFNEQRVDTALNKSKKARMLLEYLVIHRGKPVPLGQLYEALWPGENISNPESALKTLVSRTRALLMEHNEAMRDCIMASHGTYHWNMRMTSFVDTFEIEELCATLIAGDEISSAYRTSLDRLLCAYMGEVLPEIAHEEWVSGYALHLENQYKKAILRALDLLLVNMDWSTIVKTCRMALVELPFEETLHTQLMHALIMQNRRNDALAQFKHVTEAYQKYLGVQAPPAIQDFYREIVRADQTLEKDMESISTDLKDGDDDQGAFICDYAIFKDIFRLQIRSLERYHMTTYLAMVRLSGVDDSVVEPLLFDETMQRLLAVLRDSLRRGDTVTRYSASQYAVILQGATVASIKNILDRIMLSFYKETAASSIRIDCRYTPLLSEADGDLAALS